MLTDKIRILDSETNTPEDILFSCLGVIFPDDITNQHGDPSTPVTFLSPTLGAINLSLADAKGKDNRRLFSHFLWNASLQLAEFVEDSDGGEWSVNGEKVLELGAGTGLASIVASLKGAESTVVTDYPAKEVLENIKANVVRNIDSRREKTSIGDVRVEGHEWGILDDVFSKENKGQFGRVLVADCLWMPWQHENLLRSIRWFLSEDGRAWVVAGFHTGRAKMSGFYEESVLKAAGLEVERIWERDCEGKEREWVVDRGVEVVTERKRWLVIGILRRDNDVLLDSFTG